MTRVRCPESSRQKAWIPVWAGIHVWGRGDAGRVRRHEEVGTPERAHPDERLYAGANCTHLLTESPFSVLTVVAWNQPLTPQKLANTIHWGFHSSHRPPPKKKLVTKRLTAAYCPRAFKCHVHEWDMGQRVAYETNNGVWDLCTRFRLSLALCRTLTLASSLFFFLFSISSLPSPHSLISKGKDQ